MDWGLHTHVVVPADGFAQLYYDDGSGVTEERSVILPVQKGANRLFFPLPETEATTIAGLRLDPLNGVGQIQLAKVRLTGPFGWELDRVSELRLKAGKGVDALTENKSGGYQFLATTTDPSIKLSWKSDPVTTPWGQLKLAGWLLFASWLVPMFAAMAALKLWPNALRRVWQCLGIAWLIWLLAHYLAPVRRIEAWVFFQLLLAPGLILLALKPQETWREVREIARNPAAWAFAAFLGFFGLLALGIPNGGMPPRPEVLCSIGALAIWPLLFGVMGKRFEISARWLLWGWIAIVALVATYCLFRVYGQASSFESRLSIRNFSMIPLYRPISGTACFMVALILLVQSTTWKRPLTRHWWIVLIVALPLVAYLFLSQSRSIILGMLGASVFLSLARNAWIPRIFAGSLLILFLWFTIGNATGFLDQISGKAAAQASRQATAAIEQPTIEAIAAEPSTDGTKPETTSPETEDETGIAERSGGGRLTIWRAYLSKIRERPILGHGFGGEQKIYIELRESMYDPQDRHLAKGTRSCHNIYVSSLYFGGIIGLLLMFGMIGTAWGWPLWLWWKTKDNRLLLATSWVTMAGIALFFESTLLAHEKEAVLLWRPNDYWIFFWGAIVFSIVQTTYLRPEKTSNI